MAAELASIGSLKQFRYVPLLAAGVVVFLGLVFLGDLSGLLWHIRTFGWWIKLSPSLFGLTADWIVWAASFLLSISPGIAMLFRRRVRPDPTILLTFLILPSLSLAMMFWSYYVGGTLLVGSGFLAVYSLISRSETFLDMKSSSAARLVFAELFAFLAMMAVGACISLLLWHIGAVVALSLLGGSPNLTDTWIGMFGIDLEVFYLARPLLSAIFITLIVAAVIALFRESLESITRPVLMRLTRGKRGAEPLFSMSPLPRFRAWVAVGRLLPYVILAGSLALAIMITLYPYTVRDVHGAVGSDSWFYLEKLGSLSKPADAFRETDRAFVLLVLFAVRAVTGLSTEWVVRLMPAISSVLLALGSFVLVKEGTGRSWVAAFAAFLSVCSAQTSLGMGAGILANWFALSLAAFAFALIVRSARLRSVLAAVGSLAVMLVLLASYAYLWAIVLAALVVMFIVTAMQFHTIPSNEWKREMGLLGGVLLGSILTPLGFLLLLATPLFGFRPAGLDPNLWFSQGWHYLTQATTPDVLASSLAALEEAFDFAGNRVDLPFLTLLSIVGLLDGRSRTRIFGRILAAAILVPAALTLVTPSLLSTWRGLYVIPLYLAGALGAETIIRRANGQEACWNSRSQLAFAGTFGAYVFMSQLSYSLRALELLMAVLG